MSYIDLILGIPLAWAIYRGFKKGLILELAMLIGLIVGLYAGLHFSKVAAEMISSNFHIQGEWLPVVSFIVVFILVLLGVYIMGKLMEKTVEALMMGILNKVGGAIFSVLKMALILSFILFMLNGLAPDKSIFPREQQQKSFLYKPILSFANFLMPKINTGKIKETLPEI
ncbi:MAG: CvpA family protein [Bacteroidales bacterium]